MTDRYAVIGNPVAHSRSPAIHQAFASQFRQRLRYDVIEAPLEGFIETVADFFAMGGAGCNVTVPFKEEALHFANMLTARAELAGAVNTLWLDDEGVCGDNTDGIGLVRDLARHTQLRGRRVVLLGAGGAARGAIAPILDEQPASLVVANRSADKAAQLANHFRDQGPISATTFEALSTADLVINATSASLAGASLPLPDVLWADGAMAYDMMYGKGDTPFMTQARQAGASACFDGLGMLVEQAAEAFFLWRGERPDTTSVLADLRAQLAQG